MDKGHNEARTPEIEEEVGEPSLRQVFGAFLHLGLTTSGGLAMVEPIRQRLVEEKGWLSSKEFLDGLALCQLLPGATVVQLATYVGYRLGRTKGALAAVAAFILPAFGLMVGLIPLKINLLYVAAAAAGLSLVIY